MKITKLDYGNYYTVRFAPDCSTFFDEVIQHDAVIELRINSFISGAIYYDKRDEFLKAWEEMQ